MADAGVDTTVAGVGMEGSRYWRASVSSQFRPRELALMRLLQVMARRADLACTRVGLSLKPPFALTTEKVFCQSGKATLNKHEWIYKFTFYYLIMRMISEDRHNEYTIKVQ